VTFGPPKISTFQIPLQRTTQKFPRSYLAVARIAKSCVGGGPVGEELRDTIDVANIHGECTQIRDDSRGEMRGAYKEALSRISRENVASDCRRRFSSVACSKCLKSK